MGLISRVSSRTYRNFVTMTDENMIKISPDLAVRQQQREEFFNNLRDYQWSLHLKSTAQQVKDEVFSNINSTKNSLKTLKMYVGREGPSSANNNNNNEVQIERTTTTLN